ncbi:MAG TPA: cytochrome c oxidase assembly protein [Candidatus Limnocylindrales bacterium]|nr:cytochrome c oxidase assembly protein [Candidatus Limnocylindrales bacterium]
MFIILAAFLYLRVWIFTRSGSAAAIPAWKASSFLLGLVLVWMAWGSPLAAYDHSLLTAHMIKHLLLMTFAPPLILLGEPMRVFWGRTPLLARSTLRRVWHRPLVERLARIVTSPVLCWTASALTLTAWHVPTLFALAVRSEIGHAVEQAMFFGAGLLFWWPVIQPWPSASTGPRWSLLLYLFLATLPCDILSGFLVFSDRVAYPVYFSTPRLFGFSVLEDQQCAAALMWTCVTLVYLVPAAIISSRLLALPTSHEHDLRQSEFSGGTVPQCPPRSLEVV